MQGGMPVTPNSRSVAVHSHQGRVEVAVVSDLRAHQRSRCSQGRPRGVAVCPSVWIPPPGTSGDSTSTPPSPGAGWRSWAAPASNSASRKGARTRSDEASFRVGCGRGGQEKGREAERENQYIHSIPQCTHFLTVWPYLNTDIKARAHTPKGLYIFQSIFRRQTNVDVVLENELTFSLTYCTHSSIGNVATAPAQAGDKWFTLLAPHISQYAHWTCNEPACTVVLEAGQRCLKVLKEKRWDGYMKRNGVCVDVHGWLTAYMSTNAWCGPS